MNRMIKSHALSQTRRIFMGVVALLAGCLAASAQTLPAPTFYPGDGSLVPTNVTIASVVQDAIVYYTTDGSLPTTNATLYIGPLALTNTTTLWAKAFKPGWTESPDVMATFYYRPVLVSVQKLVRFDDSLRPSVNIAVTPASDVRCYAVQDVVPVPLNVINVNLGGVWDATNRTIRWGPFSDNQPRSLTYQVSGSDGAYQIPSQISLNGYSTWSEDITTTATLTLSNAVGTVATPTISPDGSAVLPVTVTLNCATTNASIYYSLDGSKPTGSSTLYTAPFAVTNPATVRAIGLQNGWNPSDVAWVTYDFAAPTATERSITNSPSPAPLIFVAVTPPTNAQSYAVEETVPPILQVTNVSDNGVWDSPTHTVRWGPFQNNTNRVLSYSLTGPDGTYTLTGVVSFDGRSYPIQGGNQFVVSNAVLAQLPAPVILAPGGFLVPTLVTITDTVVSAEIHYTLDGSLPQISSPIYTAPLNVTNPTTLRARAFLTGWLPSDTVSADFGGAGLASAVMRSITTYTNTSWQEILLTTAPTADITSYAVQEQLPLLLTPTNISANGVWDPQTGIIRWGPFQDGLPRILTNQVTGPAGSYTLQGTASFNGQSVAIAGDTNLVLNQIVLQPAATPQISPASANSLPVTVSISDTTTGADIYYTTDGTVPTQASAHYTGQFQIAQPVTLRARAFASGYAPSDVAGADYLVAVIAGSATRSVTNSGTKSPTVSLALAPTGGAHSYAVAEILPAGLLPNSINSGGVWDATNSIIRWGPFQDHNNRTLTYTLTGADGNYNFDGVASFDGQSFAIGGANATAISGSVSFVATPVVSPADGSTMPVNVSISCATPGAAIYYTLDSTVPTTNSFFYAGSFYPARAGTVRARAFASGYVASDTASANYSDAPGQSAATRTITGSPSRIQNVQVSVTPASDVKTWAVQETLPLMLWPSTINAGGLWHGDSGTIEWGPFMDHTARNLSYSVSGMDGTYNLGGLTSFDGKSYGTVGNSTVYIYFPPPTNLVAVPGNHEVELLWPRIAGAIGYNVHFWAAGSANNVQIRDASVPDSYYRLTGLTNNTKYYFTVAAYDSLGHEGELSSTVSAIPCGDCGTAGVVWFDKVYYNATNPYAIVTVQDADLNNDPNSVQTVNVQVTSDSDAFGITLTLTETDTNSGIFTSQATGTNASFTLGNSDNTSKLIHVRTADRIYVSYADLQPPISVTTSAGYDSAIPQTTLSITGPLQSAGGTNIISRISSCLLSATDIGTGVASTLYSVDGGAWTAYTNQIQFAADGPHTLDFYSTDVAGNVESSHHQPLLVQTMIPQFGQSQLLPDGSIQLAIFGENNGTYTLQTSTNLVDWTTLTQFTCNGSPSYVTDTAAGAYNQRFYRLVAP
jgi:hypothetical protein